MHSFVFKSICEFIRCSLSNGNIKGTIRKRKSCKEHLVTDFYDNDTCIANLCLVPFISENQIAYRLSKTVSVCVCVCDSIMEANASRLRFIQHINMKDKFKLMRELLQLECYCKFTMTGSQFIKAYLSSNLLT